MSPPLTKPSSTPAKQDWHPSSLAYATISNPQDVFDSITSEAKSTAETGTDLYDLGRTSRRWALAGLVFSGIFSISCIITGTVIIATHGGNGVMPYLLTSTLQQEMPALVLNLLVTVCTESAGFAHGISLRSALASESRLRFNANLRLLTAARGWRNPNGILLNGAMAILLILSYTLSSLAIPSSGMIVGTTASGSITTLRYPIVGLPLLLLGVALLVQVVIAFLGIRAVKVLTWSSSPFDVTAALVHHIQLIPVPLRCMRGVSDVDVHVGPTKPFEVQPSAWHAHPSVRKVIMSLWGLVVGCAIWAAIVILIWNNPFRKSQPSSELLSFFPNLNSSTILLSYHSGGATVQWWTLSIAVMVLVQGPLTFGLHCSELITSVIRDERYWRCATRRKGLRMKSTALNSFFTDPFSLVLFVAKPTLHWMFGLSFNFNEFIFFQIEDVVSDIAIAMYPAQIGNLCIALLILACFFTVIALYRPRGPQPAAYGHLQTLANLIDEWSPVMWWGHKEDEIPYCHAGTSDRPLEAVKMDCVYAGSDAMSHPPDLPLGRDLQA